jgi:hypothetical protein
VLILLLRRRVSLILLVKWLRLQVLLGLVLLVLHVRRLHRQRVAVDGDFAASGLRQHILHRSIAREDEVRDARTPARTRVDRERALGEGAEVAEQLTNGVLARRGGEAAHEKSAAEREKGMTQRWREQDETPSDDTRSKQGTDASMR